MLAIVAGRQLERLLTLAADDIAGDLDDGH
jgi:hypothetical protein